MGVVELATGFLYGLKLGPGRNARVVRGGSWNNNARNCRSANRNRNDPGNRNNNIGFRVCFRLHFRNWDETFPDLQGSRTSKEWKEVLTGFQTVREGGRKFMCGAGRVPSGNAPAPFFLMANELQVIRD